MSLAAAILAGSLVFAQETERAAFRQLEAEAATALKTDTPAFAERAALVDRLDAARGGETGEPAARLALLWLRSIKWMLASIPLAQRDGEPHHDWIEQHRELVIYSEPAGEWLIHPEVIWKVHDQYRERTPAEAIAWLAVENGLPGECEGYVPCYAHGMDALDAEYLRRHPRGEHVAEVVERMKGTLEQAVRLIGEPDGKQFLNPATDCGDLKGALPAVRAALVGSPSSTARDQSVAFADQILAMCPP